MSRKHWFELYKYTAAAKIRAHPDLAHLSPAARELVVEEAWQRWSMKNFTRTKGDKQVEDGGVIGYYTQVDKRSVRMQPISSRWARYLVMHDYTTVCTD